MPFSFIRLRSLLLKTQQSFKSILWLWYVTLPFVLSCS